MTTKVPASKRKGGRPAFRPTPEQRAQVSRLKFGGANDETIAAVLEISVNTLVKHFFRELDLSRAELLGQVAASLYNAALGGNVVAGIFIMKTRGGWRETDRHEITGADGAPLTPELPPLVMVEYVESPRANEGDPPLPS